MPNDITALDVAGNALATGDLVTIRARIVDNAGGVGMVVIQLLDNTDAARSGAVGLDRITISADYLERD